MYRADLRESILLTAELAALEGIRLDEEPASKAGSGLVRWGFESLTLRLEGLVHGKVRSS